MTAPLIVVGLENTPSSAAALRWAAGEAVRLGAHLLAVHAWELPARPDRVLEHDLAGERREVCERAHAWVIDALAPIGIDVPVTIEVRDGLAGPTLVAAAHDARMLVLGSGAREQDAFGSSSSDVVRYCQAHDPCEIVVIDGPRSYPALASAGATAHRHGAGAG
jgi:nucleotide-binding universal stress UspA family protein